jgi:hypothetical protein
MGIFVIGAYRPIEDREDDLLSIVKDHIPILRSQGLVTDRPAHVMRAADGTIVEVFEWKSEKAIDEAQRNAAVLALWERFGKAATYIPLRELTESGEVFANFEAVEL